MGVTHFDDALHTANLSQHTLDHRVIIAVSGIRGNKYLKVAGPHIYQGALELSQKSSLDSNDAHEQCN